MDKRLEMIRQIETAVAEMRVAVENDDYKDILDWGITVQVVTAELAATVITRVRNN